MDFDIMFKFYSNFIGLNSSLCRSAGVEQLMYIKEDLIIPHVSAMCLTDTPMKTTAQLLLHFDLIWFVLLRFI